MILYFLRHASAGEHFASPKKDEKRALDKEGIEQCGYIGRALVALDVHVDCIISSPLKRCTQTASLVGNELGYEGKLQLDNGLRPEAGLADFRKLAAETTRGCIVLERPDLLKKLVEAHDARDATARQTALAELAAMTPRTSQYNPQAEVPEKNVFYRLAKRLFFNDFGVYAGKDHGQEK